MAIVFDKVIKQARFLDPGRDFADTTLSYEVRTDPLTGDQCRVMSYRFRLPEKPDLSLMVAKSREMGCPFCPEFVDRVTPKFPEDFIPEGRIHLGDSTLVPNIMPYERYGAVASLSSRHFIEMSELSEEVLAGGFLAAQSYLRRVLEYDPEAKYHSINCNYLPPAGASLVHPHFQIAADDRPTTYQRKLIEGSRDYSGQNSTNFWADLIAEEQKIGERYAGAVGNVVWLIPFVPKNKFMPDAMAIFQGVDSIVNVSEADFRDFARGLCRVLSYFSEQNFCCFNLAVYSGLMGEDYLWTTARVAPRGTLPPLDCCDHDHIQKLHDEYGVAMAPEDVCSELKGYFA